MLIIEIKIQAELCRLLNKWSEGYETTLLEQFAKWTNENLLSPYEIIEEGKNYGKSDMWILKVRDAKSSD